MSHFILVISTLGLMACKLPILDHPLLHYHVSFHINFITLSPGLMACKLPIFDHPLVHDHVTFHDDPMIIIESRTDNY